MAAAGRRRAVGGSGPARSVLSAALGRQEVHPQSGTPHLERSGRLPGIEGRDRQETHLELVEHAGEVSFEVRQRDIEGRTGGEVDVQRPQSAAGPGSAEEIAEDDKGVGADQHAAEVEDAGVGEGFQDAGRGRVGHESTAGA